MSIFDSSTPALSGQKVPCEVGKTPVLSPLKYVIYHKNNAGTLFYNGKGDTRIVTDISQAKVYDKPISARQACRRLQMFHVATLCRQCQSSICAKGLEICHSCANGAIKAMRPQQVQLAQARAGSMEAALVEVV